jgi:hypothetical protein
LHYASTSDYRQFCDEIFGEFLPSRNYDYTNKGIRKRTKEYKKTLDIYEGLFGIEPDEILWESPVDLTINSKNGFQHVNLFKYVCLSIYAKLFDGFQYQNTMRRDKDHFYNFISDEIIDKINSRNEIKFLAAKGNSEFECLAKHRVVEEDHSIDSEEEREEAEELAASSPSISKSIADTTMGNIEEHEDGAAYRQERFQTSVVRKSDRKPSENENKNENSKNQEKEKRLEHKVIYDPVLTKGGFKFIPKYHDCLVFDERDLIDRTENQLYDDYIHKGSKKFKDIFDVAILSRADVDIVFLSNLKIKKEIGIDKSLLDLKKDEINFEFDKNEKFVKDSDSEDMSSDNKFKNDKYSEKNSNSEESFSGESIRDISPNGSSENDESLDDSEDNESMSDNESTPMSSSR